MHRPKKKTKPTILTPSTHKALCDLVAQGKPQVVVAESIGVARSSLYNWLRRGTAGEEPFAAFVSDFRRSVALGKLALIDEMRGAETKQWQRIAWLLERMDPKQFGPRDVGSEQARRIKTLERKLRKAEQLFANLRARGEAIEVEVPSVQNDDRDTE